MTLESVGPNGIAGNGDSINPDISSDGRYVVFESASGNLTNVAVAVDWSQVFLRDRETGATRMLNSNPSGEPGNGPSRNPAISGDGTTIVFESGARDLIERDGSPRGQVGVYLVRPSARVRERIDATGTADARKAESVSAGDQ